MWKPHCAGGACIAGALDEADYRDRLSRSGFEAIDIEPTRIYRTADAKQFLGEAGLWDEAVLAQIDGRIMSASVRATKPMAAARGYGGPACCA